MVLIGPAADEILEFHFVRLMVFAGPASDSIFVLQIARFVVLTGPAADEILELHFLWSERCCLYPQGNYLRFISLLARELFLLPSTVLPSSWIKVCLECIGVFFV